MGEPIFVPDPDDCSEAPFRGRGHVRGKTLVLTIEFDNKDTAENALLKFLRWDK